MGLLSCGFRSAIKRETAQLWRLSRCGGRCLPFLYGGDDVIAEGLLFDVVKLIGKAGKILEIPAIFLHRQQYRNQL